MIHADGRQEGKRKASDVGGRLEEIRRLATYSMLGRAGWVVQIEFVSRLQIKGYGISETPSNGVIEGIKAPTATQVSDVCQDERPSKKPTTHQTSKKETISTR